MAKRYPSMLSSSRLLSCVKFIMRIKISTLQGFDDSAPTASPTDSAEKVSSEAGNPEASAQQTILDEHSGSILTGHYIIVGMILFTIATMIFVLSGGLRWLRRVIATRSHGRYRKVHDEDLEK
jgi:hypothetical protein